MTIKRAPEYWRYLPYFSRVRGLLFLRSIYLRADIYDDMYVSGNPQSESMSILIHEQTHFNRMQEMGMIRFGIKYIFSSRGRFEEEIAAITEQMKYLKSHGCSYDLERMAKALSGWLYMWCATYDEAYIVLDTIWNSV